ncbi:MAG: helix-turn-helix transcriptional regulator, partial [Oscillospiraceae bacterium]|nr:helix-turn-helix transcriptional regulator [Oscillospiraceae bacterium]
MNSRIKQIRQDPKINLSQEAFGARIGLTAAGISKIESGQRNASEQVILSICREYGVNEEWLRNGKGVPFVETAEDTLREIVRSRGLDDEDYELLREFINFSPEDRKALIRMLRQLAGHMENYSAQ